MDNFFSAQGRIGRRTFFFRRMGILVSYFVTCAGIGATLNFFSADSNTATALVGLLFIPFAIADILQAIKRCHDINRSGWYVLLTCIPVAGIVAGIPLLFVKGTAGPNRFGSDPLGYSGLSLTDSYVA